MDFSIEKLQSVLPFEKQKNDINENQQFQAAVLAPFIKIKGRYHLLFEKRALHIRQGGEISFPGGGVEKSDNTYEETAIRETMEELQITANTIRVLGSLPVHGIPNRAIVYPYVGEIISDFSTLTPSKDEVDYLFTVPLDYFLKNKPQVLSRSAFPKERGMGKVKEDRQVYLYDYHGEKIWGLTAEIIVTLMNKIIEMEE